MTAKGQKNTNPRKMRNSVAQQVLKERRQVRVWELYAQHIPQFQIREILIKEGYTGTSQSTVSNDLNCIRDRYLEDMKEGYDAHLVKELSRIDAVEKAAWEEFEFSKIKSTVIKGEKGKPDKTIVSRKIAATEWPPIILKCVEMRCKLLKLGKEESSTTNNVVVQFPFDALVQSITPEDQLRMRIAEVEQPLKGDENEVAS